MLGHGVKALSSRLASLGAPDVTAEAIAFAQNDVTYIADPKLVGKYGSHSPGSQEAFKIYSESASRNDLWLCGHFTAKTFAAVLQVLEQFPEEEVLMWQTKSAVQPKGSEDEWARFQSCPKPVKAWSRGVTCPADYSAKLRHVTSEIKS